MLKLKTKTDIKIPSIKRIQEILVAIGDKEPSFVSSRDWIGGAETCFVIDELFHVPCFLHHITSNESISSKRTQITDYFKSQGGLIAMGGDQDASSKLIAGVHVSENGDFWLLVVVSLAATLYEISHLNYAVFSRILTLLESQEI
jgi:Ufm1-specific protease 1